MRISSVLPQLTIVVVTVSTGTAAFVVATNASIGHDNRKGLIANGRIYEPTEYPFVVYLTIYSFFNGNSICTGSLISSKFVLTAAHCTYRAFEHNIMVFHKIDSKNSSFRTVRRIYQHWKYNSRTGHADISLLKLNKPFTDVKRFAVLSGHPSDFDNDTALNCLVIGFGIVNQIGMLGINGYITEAVVKFGPLACELPFKIYILSTWKEYLCSKPDSHMICPGDSGGPMICNGYQYGIASHAYNFRNTDEQAEVVCGSPDVQTRHLFLYVFRDWIAETLRSGTAARRGQSYGAILTVLPWALAAVFT